MLAVRHEDAELRQDVAGQGTERRPLGVVEIQAGAGHLARVVAEADLVAELADDRAVRLGHLAQPQPGAVEVAVDDPNLTRVVRERRQPVEQPAPLTLDLRVLEEVHGPILTGSWASLRDPADPPQRTTGGREVDAGDEVRRRAPGTLRCDIDVLRTMIGGWEDDYGRAGALIRPAALGLIASYLRESGDVVLPQLIARATELARFERAASDAGAGFVHVLLLGAPETCHQRFEARGTDEPHLRAAKQTVDEAGGVEVVAGYRQASSSWSPTYQTRCRWMRRAGPTRRTPRCWLRSRTSAPREQGDALDVVRHREQVEGPQLASA